MRASCTSSAMSSGNRGRIARPSGSAGARSHLRAASASPGLEHLIGPPLLVALGGGEAVGSDRERLLGAVGDTQQLAVPHVREPQALVVAGEDPVAIGLGDQLVSRSESVVGVLERAL